MTFYNFCYKYLLDQTQKFTKLTENDLQKYFDCHLYGWSPYFTTIRGKETKNDLMKMFAFILQNRFILPCVINFCKKYYKLKTILHSFNDEYIRRNEKKVYNNLIKLSNNKNEKSWKIYIDGLIDSAKFLQNYNNFKEFDYDVKNNNIIKKLTKITGIGEVMARNFLKEIGKIEYGKPDSHLKCIFEIIENKHLNEQEFDFAIKNQAKIGKISVYKLDRIIWLICSGNYFKDNDKIKNYKGILRKNFEKILKQNLSKIQLK